MVDNGTSETLKNQIDAINKKIDNLTNIVASLTTLKSTKSVDAAVEVKKDTKVTVKNTAVKAPAKAVKKAVAKVAKKAVKKVSKKK
jgi:hypothetical protein